MGHGPNSPRRRYEPTTRCPDAIREAGQHQHLIAGLLPRLPPPSLTGFILGAEPAFAVLGRYARLLIELLARHMIDALAGFNRHVAFDVARS